MSSRPLAQRRDAQHRHPQPVVQVAAEPALLDFLFQVAVGRGDDAHIHFLDPGRTDGDDLLVLEEPQKFDLHAERQLADFVEKEGPLVGHLAEARLALDAGPGKSARGIAEQLGLDQVFRNGGAVELEEGLLAPRTGAVNRSGEKLLAHARFTQDQHGGVGCRDLFDELVEVGHLPAFEAVHGELLDALLVDVLNVGPQLFEQFFLGNDLLPELAHDGHVAHKCDHQRHLALRVENGVAVQDQLLALLGGLDGGRGLAGFDDLRVEDDIEDALIDEVLHPAADQVFFFQADQLLVHRVDLERVALTVGDVDAVAQDIQDTVYVLFDLLHSAPGLDGDCMRRRICQTGRLRSLILAPGEEEKAAEGRLQVFRMPRSDSESMGSHVASPGRHDDGHPDHLQPHELHHAGVDVLQRPLGNDAF